jgi:hypothetical protein
MTGKKYDSEPLEQLAHEIAEDLVTQITEQESGDGPAVFEKRQCPEGQLCCFKNYTCKGGMYTCDGVFRCSNGFTVSKAMQRLA